MCQLDWVSACCRYWSWWVQDRHKEHRQQWLRPSTSGSWKVWCSDSKPCRICWVDECKCWSWKKNLWFWVWTVLFIVFINTENYEQIGNKITQNVVRQKITYTSMENKIALLSSCLWESVLLYLLLFWGYPMSPSSGAGNMVVYVSPNNQNFIPTIVKNTQRVKLFCGYGLPKVFYINSENS